MTSLLKAGRLTLSVLLLPVLIVLAVATWGVFRLVKALSPRRPGIAIAPSRPVPAGAAAPPAPPTPPQAQPALLPTPAVVVVAPLTAQPVWLTAGNRQVH